MVGVSKDSGMRVGKESGMVELVETRAWYMSDSHLISWHDMLNSNLGLKILLGIVM